MKKIGLMVLLLAVGVLIAAAPASAVNSLVVNAGAALNGTNFGLAVTVGPNGADNNAVYVESQHPVDETHMEIRLRFRTQSLDSPSTGGGRTFRFLNMRSDFGGGKSHKILFLQRQNTGNWRFAAWNLNNANAFEFLGGFFIGPYHEAAEHQIRCEWTKATAPSNGIFHCERTEAPAQNFTVSNVDDSNYDTDAVQVGFFDFDNFGATTGGAGKLDVDEYESYR